VAVDRRLTDERDARLVSGFDRLFAHGPPARLGLAVSGGGDSTALLLLAEQWARRNGTRLAAVTVNHNLRPEAADEAALAARACARLGISHQTVSWQGWNGQGNLQDAARQARRRLIAAWALDNGIDAVALGHTLDDQAETVLLRLARGSGVDGLSGMSRAVTVEGVRILRPLLHLRRDELRDFLRARGQNWAEDPSNQDARFARVRARRALAALAGLGLDAEGLVETAARLSVARAALGRQTYDAARQLVRVNDAGAVMIERDGFFQQPEEIRRRLLAHSLQWVGGAPYRPRLRALLRLVDQIRQGRGGSLGGCLAEARAQRVIAITREPAAVAHSISPPSVPWDGRWQMDAPTTPVDCLVAALGEKGLAQCPHWRETGLERAALLASPAVWRGQELVAAPLAGFANGWSCRRVPANDHYFSSIISH